MAGAADVGRPVVVAHVAVYDRLRPGGGFIGPADLGVVDGNGPAAVFEGTARRFDSGVGGREAKREREGERERMRERKIDKRREREKGRERNGRRGTNYVLSITKTPLSRVAPSQKGAKNERAPGKLRKFWLPAIIRYTGAGRGGVTDFPSPTPRASTLVHVAIGTSSCRDGDAALFLDALMDSYAPGLKLKFEDKRLHRSLGKGMIV